MRSFSGILRHEIGMSLRRKGLWIAYGLLFVFHTVLLFTPPPIGEMVKREVIGRGEVWHVAGRFLLACNVFFPVVAGILSADRVRRDFRLGVRELQDSTPLSRHVYVLTKYLGALASSLLPLFLWVMGIAAFMTAGGGCQGLIRPVPIRGRPAGWTAASSRAQDRRGRGAAPPWACGKDDYIVVLGRTDLEASR